MADENFKQPFDLMAFTTRLTNDAAMLVPQRQRDIARLTAAAWATGSNLDTFRLAARTRQIELVECWVNEALEHADERRARKAETV